MKQRHRHLQKPVKISTKLIKLFQELSLNIKDIFANDVSKFVEITNHIWVEFPNHQIETVISTGTNLQNAGVYINFKQHQLGRVHLKNSTNELVLEHPDLLTIYLPQDEQTQLHRQIYTKFDEVLSSLFLPNDPSNDDIIHLVTILEKVMILMT